MKSNLLCFPSFYPNLNFNLLTSLEAKGSSIIAIPASHTWLYRSRFSGSDNTCQNHKNSRKYSSKSLSLQPMFPPKSKSKSFGIIPPADRVNAQEV